MAWPAGIITRTVNAGAPVILEDGTPCDVEIDVKASRSLVWNGVPLVSAKRTFKNKDTFEPQFAIPVCDQDGYRDGQSGQPIATLVDGAVSHRWQITMRYVDPNTRKEISTRTVGPFALLTGDGSPVDLDTVVSTPGTAEANPVYIPDMWSEQVAAAQAAAEEVAAVAAATDAGTADKIQNGPATRAALSAATAVPRTTAPATRRGTTLTTFQAGHGWAKVSGTATVADDTVTYSRGSQSLKLTTAGDNGVTVVGIENLSRRIDFTRNDLRITVRVSDWSKVANNGLKVRFGNDLTGNYYDRNFGPSQSAVNPQAGNTYPLQGSSGEWQTTTLALSIQNGGAASGSRYRQSCDSVGIVVQDNGSPVTVNVQAVEVVPKVNAFPQGVVSFTFDDGSDSWLLRAAPILDKYGFPATAFVIADYVDDPGAGRIGHAGLRELQDRHGWEIACHAMTHADHDAPRGLASLTADGVLVDMAAQRAWALAHGYNGADFTAYPQGYYSAETLDAARRVFASARTTIDYDGLETIPPQDPHRVRISPLYDGVSLATIQARVDAAKASGEWLIFYSHRVETDLTGVQPAISASTSYLQSVVDYVAASGVPVRTYGDVIRSTITASSPTKARTDTPQHRDYTFAGWSFDPVNATDGSATPGAGVMWGQRVLADPGAVCSNIYYYVSTAAVGASNAYLGVYDSTGQRLSVSSDISTGGTIATIDGTGYKKATVPPFTVPADGVVVVVLLVGAATTLPQLGGKNAGGALNFGNHAALTAGPRCWQAGAGLTSLPATLPAQSDFTRSPFIAIGT